MSFPNHFVVQSGLTGVAGKKEGFVDTKNLLMFSDLLTKIWDLVFLDCHFQDYSALGYDAV
jgi:hypothetical protein